jgi:hypothetical protein
MDDGRAWRSTSSALQIGHSGRMASPVLVLYIWPDRGVGAHWEVVIGCCPVSPAGRSEAYRQGQ